MTTDPRRALARLPVGARADLLRVLTGPSHVRADVIGQFFQRPNGREMAEVLIDLEEKKRKRVVPRETTRKEIAAERVDVVLCAKGLRGPRSLERYQEADKARVARWLAAHAETVRGRARKMAATPGPKPRAPRSSK